MSRRACIAIAIILMFLITPFACAKQESVDVGTAKQDKKTDDAAVDKTKESAKEIKNKDKDITGKITVTDSDSFVTPSVVVGVSFVIGSAIIASFINKFRRRE